MANELLFSLNLDSIHSDIFLCKKTTLFEDFGALPGPPLVVCDENTADLDVAFPPGMPVATVPAGERCKQPGVLLSLLDTFMQTGLTRGSTVYAFGGGAVTDLVAFAGSIYLRGVRVVLVPTSLLAMVDAAVGGKTGIDFYGFKNMIGTFAPAAEVRIAPALLDSLPQKEFLSGLAEVLKAAFLGDSTLVNMLETRSQEVLGRDGSLMSEIIRRAVAVKAAVVQADFTEQGQRAFLNLGHTFGHALESALGLSTWTHGEAVAWGIARAMRAGVAEGITDSEWARRVTGILRSYGYNTGASPLDPAVVIQAMQKDKKRTSRGVQFVLQRGPQENVLHTMERNRIMDILKQ
jgi:3-dehydroquinate synthase